MISDTTRENIRDTFDAAMRLCKFGGEFDGAIKINVATERAQNLHDQGFYPYAHDDVLQAWLDMARVFRSKTGCYFEGRQFRKERPVAP